VLAFVATIFVVAPRHRPAIYRRPQRAQIDEEETARRWIAADARMLARHVDSALDPDVDSIRDASAANDDGVLADVERVRAVLGGVLDARVDRGRGRRRGFDGFLAARRRLSDAAGRDTPGPLSRSQLRLRRQQQLRVDENIALGEFAVGIRKELDAPL